MDRTWLLNEEEKFWNGEARFFEQHLAHDALMVFAEPIGVLVRERVISEIAAAPRWARVVLQDVRWLSLGPDSVIMTYAADAQREGGEPYRALVSSAYVRRAGNWKLAFHQQTPTGSG